MIDPKTYERALRAARNVARSSGRAAVGLGLIANTTGCLSSSGSSTAGEDVAADAALEDAASDASSDIIDAVLADLAADSAVVADAASTVDATWDAGPGDTSEPDAAAPDATLADAEPTDGGGAGDASPDVLTEVIEGDGTSTDVAQLCECLTPTDLACTGWETTSVACTTDEDCADIDWQGSDSQCGDDGMCQLGLCEHEDQPFSGLICFQGVCNEPEGFGECCEAAWNDPACAEQQMPIPGCTPWGPPAPGAYDGLTLADYGLA